MIRLLRGGHFRLHIERRLQEIRMGIAAVLAEKENGADVRRAAFIQRKQEPQGRRAGQPLRRTLMENTVGGDIPQSGLLLLYGTDCAEK